ncbi:MAG: tRNA epoxyqueuosine(34) reductase QueG [Sphingorhabdus sp.]|uniref:tRNA epoxyqueuosine(34) reductase QueG n=1 Tax=Sphingorhabdus sp. TaxID=1902408 RepID=UPI003CB99C8E
MKRHKTNLVNALKDRAKAEGFADCRIAPGHLAPAAGERLRQWLSEGRHGDMLWMADRVDQRSSPVGLWPEVQSVIILGMSYAPETDPLALALQPEFGRISVYAQRKDYHDVVKGALKRLAQWFVHQTGSEVKVFVDTAPVLEKTLAEAAGLGWQGKHSNLVSREHGSWLLLGAIYTTAELESDAPGRDRCGSCSACQIVCPTDAFPEPYRVDARRCISYLTIEHKGPIPSEFRRAMGNHIYGCDDCLAACPWNKFAETASVHKALAQRLELSELPLAQLLALDDIAFRALFAGTPIKRTGRDRFVRNAAVAAGNSGDKGLAKSCVRLLDDASPLVRGAAIWALAQLDENQFSLEKRTRLKFESDESVLLEWEVSAPTMR